MDTIFNDVCALVTAAFALTLVPGFRQPAYSLLSRRDQGTALLVFMSLGLLEEATAFHADWLNERIVAVCARCCASNYGKPALLRRYILHSPFRLYEVHFDAIRFNDAVFQTFPGKFHSRFEPRA